MVDLGTSSKSSGGIPPQICKIPQSCKKCMFFLPVDNFVRDLFLQSSLGTPLEHFGPIWALIWFPFRSMSDSILFNFAFRWACFRKVLPSKLGVVKLRRRNSRRDNNFAS